ncbi:MAG: IS1182 family transposase [Nanoarchaeota archaeon]
MSKKKEVMSFITANRNQLNFIGYCIDDFVEHDSKSRYIVKIVDQLDLSDLYNNYSSQGGEAYDPKIMLSTWFLGYCEQVTTTRKLEYNCRKNLDFIYVSGNLKPDHCSLSRFRKRNLDLLSKYFIEIIRLAHKKGMIDFKEIAIDGSKQQAVSSKKKSFKQRYLQDYLKAVERDIESYMDKLDEELDNVEKEKYLKRIKRLNHHREKLQKANEVLEARKSEIKKEYRETHQVNIEEPDALMMDGYSGYNIQIGVDTKTQLIVSADVVQDRNDQKQFSVQHKKIEENIKEASCSSEGQRVYIADGGYASYEQIGYVITTGVDAYIPVSKESKPSKEITDKEERVSSSDFQYDEKGDCYVCPNGKTLHVKRRERNKYFQGKVYQTDECCRCPLKSKCLGERNKTNLRTIKRDDRKVYYERMDKKIKNDKGMEIMKKRRITVEPVIGNLKSNMGYRRFRLRGLENVKGEFILMCIGHNLNKIFGLLFFYFYYIINRFFRKILLKPNMAL